jgi:hypothetical protein
MKYEKPQISTEVAAVAAVRGGKSEQTGSDSYQLITTLAAYQADE